MTENIHNFTFDEYLDYDQMVKSFFPNGAGCEEGIGVLLRAGQSIEKFNQDGLIGLLYTIYKKWPTNISKPILIRAAKRAIQTMHYERIYKRPPSKTVLDTDQECIDLLKLADTRPVKTQAKERTTMMSNQADNVSNKPEVEKPKKVKPPKNEFSAKVAVMSLDDLIKWATEVGVPQENINKHKAKPIGLAKMNISNMIRARVKKT